MADSKKYNGSAWEHSLRKLTTATEAVENPLYSDGTAITSYTISGNMSQTGTPTPANPVEVNGVGVRTENLWGETSATNRYISNQGNTGTSTDGDVYSLKTFTVSPSTTYTFSWSGFTVGNDNNLPYIRICFYTSNGGTFISRTLVNPNDYLDKYVSFTIPNNCTYVDIRIDSEASTRGQHFDNLMLNTGSTAKPYEPYGYKIPISSGGVITNIYLGNTQTVRAIKKVVFDGSENWQGPDNAATKYLDIWNYDYYKVESGVTCMSTHYSGANNIVSGNIIPNNSACFYKANSPRLLYLKGSEPITLADFKAYLAQQYANGTPVTVWYVLATPKTAAVNEPLMKIGDYADTVSDAASIPITEGANSITVDTTVQPSEFTATWTGWHNAMVKEWDGSQWNE